MKIALQCQSVLIQDSLRYYLSSYLCDSKDCDFIISDYLTQAQKPIYFLSFEKKTLPFIPDQLLKHLKHFHQGLQSPPSFTAPHTHKLDQDSQLREEIQALLAEFTERFLQVVKKHR